MLKKKKLKKEKSPFEIKKGFSKHSRLLNFIQSIHGN